MGCWSQRAPLDSPGQNASCTTSINRGFGTLLFLPSMSWMMCALTHRRRERLFYEVVDAEWQAIIDERREDVLGEKLKGLPSMTKMMIDARDSFLLVEVCCEVL